MSLHFPYLPTPVTGPAPPTLPAGVTQRWRPLIPVRIESAVTGRFCEYEEAILDTGSDDTVFPISDALQIGVPLMPVSVAGYRLRWRGSAHALRFGAALLRLFDGSESWVWPATIAFTPAPMRYPILGQASFLQFMNATFHGESRAVTLDPVPSFPGTVTRAVNP
jgi:hypothetical protein